MGHRLIEKLTNSAFFRAFAFEVFDYGASLPTWVFDHCNSSKIHQILVWKIDGYAIDGVLVMPQQSRADSTRFFFSFLHSIMPEVDVAIHLSIHNKLPG